MTVNRPCTDCDLPVLKRLWLTCFEERGEAAELFFQRNKSTFHAYACEMDGTLVSALYLIDGSLHGAAAHYLCGAATLPAFRGRGLMSALIRYALADAVKRGDRYSLLFPASDGLYDFYARCGYRPACAAKSAVLTADTDRTVRGGQPDLQALQAAIPADNAFCWRSEFIRFAADYYGCYGAKTAQSADAFAIYQPDGECTEVIYAVYRERDDLKALLQAEGIGRFRLTAPAASPLLQGCIIRPFGMIRPLSGDTLPADVYLGITLN